jgi:hypothetical protein
MNSFSFEAGSTCQPATGDRILLRMGSVVLETLKEAFIRISTWGLVRMALATGDGKNESGIETGRSVDLPGNQISRVSFQRSAMTPGIGSDLVSNPVGA